MRYHTAIMGITLMTYPPVFQLVIPELGVSRTMTIVTSLRFPAETAECARTWNPDIPVCVRLSLVTLEAREIFFYKK